MKLAEVEDVQRRSPGVSRRPVLFRSPEDTAVILVADPGQWHLIATGAKVRHGTIAQAAHRIRTGGIQAFDRADGAFESWVSTDKSVEDRIADVEMYGRFIPVDSMDAQEQREFRADLAKRRAINAVTGRRRRANT